MFLPESSYLLVLQCSMIRHQMSQLFPPSACKKIHLNLGLSLVSYTVYNHSHVDKNDAGKGYRMLERIAWGLSCFLQKERIGHRSPQGIIKIPALWQNPRALRL